MRTLSKTWNYIILAISIVIVLFQIYIAGFGVLDDAFQRSIHLAFILPLCFILKPAYNSQKKDRVPIHDLLFSVIAVSACLYVAFMNNQMIWNVQKWYSVWDRFFAYTLCLLILEAGRRTVGYVFIVMAAFFLFYALAGPIFPGMWGHKAFSIEAIMQSMYHASSGMWGTMTGLAANLLAIFGVFGAMLSATGGAETFIRIGKRLVGNAVGGSGKVALISSGLFGMISGQPVANVMATGSFTVPMMKQDGYTPEWTAATVALGSTGSMIMPPIMGAGAFIMAQLIGVNYASVAKAAIFPAFLYYLGALFAIHYQSKKLQIFGSSSGNVEKVTPRQYIVIVIPIAIFLYLIINNYSTTLAACYATFTGVIVYLLCYLPLKKGVRACVAITGKSLKDICLESAKAMISMTTLMVSAQLVIVLINYSGFAVKLSNLIVSIGQDSLFLCLVLSMGVCIILGMGLPATASYIIGAAVLVPSLVQLGVATMPAHMFVFYYSALSNITPPVCSAVYVSSSIARSNWVKTGILSCMIALPVFIIPFAFIYCNGMLFLHGSGMGETVYAFVTAVVGVYAVSTGVAGYIGSNMSMTVRLLVVGAGIVMVTPFIIPSTVAIIVAAILIVYNVLSGNKRSKGGQTA
ncbi:C4-dicarboxylate ABC transporter [Synergistales bacterium]|nr:C4-dicarboxylate ABC transporter [Synergistales bacterium]